MNGLDVLAATFSVAALLQIDRKGFLQGLVARPLVAALGVALWLGDEAAGVLVGVPLSLLWLYEAQVGVHPPEHEVVGGAGVTAAAIYAGGGSASPETAALALVLLPAAATLGRLAETRIDTAQAELQAVAMRRVARGRDPWPANLAGLLLPAAGAGLLAAATGLFGGLAVHMLLPLLHVPSPGAVLGMALLTAGAVTGAVTVAQSRFPEATVVGGAATAMGLGLFLVLEILSQAPETGAVP